MAYIEWPIVENVRVPSGNTKRSEAIGLGRVLDRQETTINLYLMDKPFHGRYLHSEVNPDYFYGKYHD
jgi:hypothetical protein